MTKSKPDPSRIRRVAESVIGLPTLPTVVSKMIELVDNPKTSAASLANLISTDQSLTARILKLANSSYYGFSREISTVNMAIVVMGFNSVRDMGLSLSVFDVFRGTKDQVFDVSQFWEHSIGCGIAAKLMARRYHNRVTGEVFVAGLLHDIGKVVLNQYMSNDFVKIMNMSKSDDITLEDAELEVIGANHGEVGAWLADKWRLPVLISDAIKYHHTPWDARKDSVMVAIVSVADYICHRCGIGNSGRENPLVPDSRTWDIFRSNDIQLEDSDLDTLETEFLLELDRNDAFMSHVATTDENK